MALEIKPTPVLEGEAAERFYQKIEREVTIPSGSKVSFRAEAVRSIIYSNEKLRPK